MIFRLSRDKRGPDRWLRLKVILFVAAAAVAVIGMASGVEWLVYVAIGLLLVGVAVRRLPRDLHERGQK